MRRDQFIRQSMIDIELIFYMRRRFPITLLGSV